MAENRLKRIAQERQATLFSSLLYMRNMKDMTDVTLVCQDSIFHAHRLVLASGSLYLRKIFQDQKDVTVINVHEVEPDIFSAILEFLYTGELHFPDQTGKRLETALIVMKNLEVCGLDELMGSLLVHNLNPLNFHYLWKIIRQSKQKDIEIEVAKFVMRNLEACRKSPQFPNLSLQQMMSILSVSDLSIRSPSSILRAIALWGAFNASQRDKYVTSLLSVVGMNSEEERCRTYMNSFICANKLTSTTAEEASVEDIQDTTRTVKNTDASTYVIKNEHTSGNDVKSAIKDAISPLKTKTISRNRDMNNRRMLEGSTSAGAMLPESLKKLKNGPLHTIMSSTRLLEKQKAFPSGLTDHTYKPYSSSGDMTKKESKLNQRSKKLQSPETQSSASGASAKSTDTYLVSNSDTDVRQESPVKKYTRPFSSSHIPPRGRNKLRTYILCLASDQSGLPIKQCYNVIDKCWMPSKPMIRVPAKNVTILHLDRVLYFMGGETEQQEKLNTVFSYQLDTRYLQQLAGLLTNRSDAAITHIGEFIYVIGGSGRYGKTLSEVEVFNPWRNLWKSVAPLNVARNSPSATSSSTMIFVAGGYSGETLVPLRVCEAYDPKTNQWTTVSPLPETFSERGGMIVMCNNYLYSIPILKPNKVYRLSSLNKSGEWKELKRCLTGLIRIMAFMSSQDTIWIFDRSGKLLQYIPNQDTWKQITQVPATMGWPIQAFLIEQSV